MGVLSLENFDTIPSSVEHGSPPQDARDLQNARVSDYETGFQAGWDDAIQSIGDDAERLDAELGRNLEELSFSFFEAQRQVCLSVESLVRTLVEKVLPELLKDRFGQLVSEMTEPLIAEGANLTAELVCAPSDLEMVRSAVAHHTQLPLNVRAEPSFARHQVRLQLGHEVREIDGDRLLSDIRTAVDSHFAQLQEPAAYVS